MSVPLRRGRLVIALVAGVLTATGCARGSQDSSGLSSTTTTGVARVAVSPSAACAEPGEPAVTERIDVVVGRVPRSALVHVPDPSASDVPLPVVLSFHGVSGSAAVQQATDGLLDLSVDEEFVVVHPEGLRVGLNDQVTGISGWDHDGDELDEPAFIAAVLDELGTSVCIDTRRVYATGFSAGGNIALVVACALSDRIAAVAPVGAAYQPGGCVDAPPMPILSFHGRDDIVVPFDGRDTPEAGSLLAVRTAIEGQAGRNGCEDEVTSENLSPRVRSLTWSGCESPTVLVELDDHGHAWPGHQMPFGRDVLVDLFAGDTSQPPNPLMVAIGATPDTMADNVLLTNDDVDASEMIWEFFASQS
jgi:polyhydroxybutyrate depolymerase